MNPAPMIPIPILSLTLASSIFEAASNEPIITRNGSRVKTGRGNAPAFKIDSRATICILLP